MDLTMANLLYPLWRIIADLFPMPYGERLTQSQRFSNTPPVWRIWADGTYNIPTFSRMLECYHKLHEFFSIGR